MEEYYTPTIEEIHVGFECEIHAAGRWHPTKVEEDFSTPPYIHYIDNELIRVRILSTDDLYDLGFKQIGGKMVRDVGQLYSKSIGRLWVHIDYTRFSEWAILFVEASVTEESERTRVVHSIRIKNVNELVKLLQQLNLYN